MVRVLGKVDIPQVSEEEDLIAYFVEILGDRAKEIEYMGQVDLKDHTSLDALFHGCSNLKAIPKLDTGNVISMKYTFSHCTSLISIPYLDTSNVKETVGMFYGCESLREVPPLDLSNVLDAALMFTGCSSLIKVPDFDTYKVIDVSKMFQGCTNLIEAPNLLLGNVGKGTLKKYSKTSSVIGMFRGCKRLTKVPEYVTNNCECFDEMFMGCKALRRIPKLNLENAKRLVRMFEDSGIEEFNLDTRNVEDFTSIFENTPNLKEATLDLSECYRLSSAFKNSNVEKVLCYNCNENISVCETFRGASKLKQLEMYGFIGELDIRDTKLSDIAIYDFIDSLGENKHGNAYTIKLNISKDNSSSRIEKLAEIKGYKLQYK